MKILFIGNSYTYFNDLPALFEKLANANGKNVSVFSVTKGDRKLIDNVIISDEYTAAIDNLLKAHHFDYVFLQEYSTLPITDYASFEEGATKLCEKARQSADNIVLYETWSRKKGCFVLSDNGWTVDSMTDGLAKAYYNLSKKINASVSYVGLNFRSASKFAELYDKDKTHPSYYGSCLAALTHYYHIFKEYPHDVSSLDMPNDTAELFKKTVEQDLAFVPEE